MTPKWLALALVCGSSVASADDTVSFSPDTKRVLAGTEGGHSFVWDLQTDKLLFTIEGTATYAGTKIIGLGEDIREPRNNAIDVWSTDGKLEKSCSGLYEQPYSVRSDGRRIIVQRRNGAAVSTGMVVDLDGCKSVFEKPGFQLGPYSPDHKHLAYVKVSNDRDAPSGFGIMNADTGAVETAVDGGGASVVAWTPDGHLVTAGRSTSGGKFVVWTLDTQGHSSQTPAFATPGNSGPDYPDEIMPATLTVSPDGMWIGAGDRDGLEWFKYPSQKFSSRWAGEVHSVFDIEYSPDKKLIATSSRGGDCAQCSGASTIHILDANASSSKILHTFKMKDLTFVKKPAGGGDPVKDEPPKQPVATGPAPLTGAAKDAMSKLEQAASQAAVWLGKMKHPEDWKHDLESTDQMKMALDFGNQCHAAVEAARKAGVPDSAPVDFNVYESDVTKPASVAEVDAKVCAPTIKFAAGVVGAQAGAKQALYAPFMKVLSGDKANIFNAQHIADGLDCTRRCSGFYGHGMKRLKTPAEFAASDVWYYYVIHRDGPITWEVEGWTFAGMTKTGVYDKTGRGEDPPASAFK